MFDDPKKELARLQAELLAAEESEESEDWQELLEDDDWEGTQRQPLYKSYSDEPEPDCDEPEPEEAELPPRQRGIGGLVAALIVETAALVGVVAWWLLCR